MAVYELSNFQLVCEDTFYGPGIGCGRELFVEQVRGIKAAVERARDEGWRVEPSGQFADPFIWFSICPDCDFKRKCRPDEYLARTAAAAGLGQPQ